MGTKPKYDSQGRRELVAYLEKAERGAGARIARACGRHQSLVTRWADGSREPHGSDYWPLEKETGIRPAAWSETPRFNRRMGAA